MRTKSPLVLSDSIQNVAVCSKCGGDVPFREFPAGWVNLGTVLYTNDIPRKEVILNEDSVWICPQCATKEGISDA